MARQKTIFDKSAKPVAMTPEDKELIDSGKVELYKDGKMIWIGELRDIPPEMVEQIWSNP